MALKTCKEIIDTYIVILWHKQLWQNQCWLGAIQEQEILSVCYTSIYIVYQKYCIQMAQKLCAIIICKWEHNIGVQCYVYVVMNAM